jgi:hypothetical protein
MHFFSVFHNAFTPTAANEPSQALFIHAFFVAQPVRACLSTPTLGIIAARALSRWLFHAPDFEAGSGAKGSSIMNWRFKTKAVPDHPGSI